jgi:type II secretion system protein I
MRRSSRAGFVLLEAVVALAVISLVSLALLQARSQQIRVASQARELLTAQALAEDRLAALRLLDYENLVRPDDSIMAGSFPAPFEEFSWVTTVEVQEDEYDLFGVDVVVTGPAERFPLSTLVHRPRAILGVGGNGEQGFGGRGGRGGGGDRAGRGGRGGRGDRAGPGGRGGRGDRAGPGGRGGRGGNAGRGGGGGNRGGGGGSARGGGGGNNGPVGAIGGAGGAELGGRSVVGGSIGGGL